MSRVGTKNASKWLFFFPSFFVGGLVHGMVVELR